MSDFNHALSYAAYVPFFTTAIPRRRASATPDLPTPDPSAGLPNRWSFRTGETRRHPAGRRSRTRCGERRT